MLMKNVQNGCQNHRVEQLIATIYHQSVFGGYDQTEMVKEIFFCI